MPAKDKGNRPKRPVGRPRALVEKVSVLVYLPRPVDRLLEEWSSELRISKSALVEQALERHGSEMARSVSRRARG